MSETKKKSTKKPADLKSESGLAALRPTAMVNPLQSVDTLTLEVASLLDKTPLDKLQPVLEDVKKVIKALQYTVDANKDRLANHVAEHGQQDPDSTFKVWSTPIGTVRARPSRQVLDAKKVEGAVRAKGLDPAKYMEQVVTYTACKEGHPNYERFMKLFNEEDRKALMASWKWMLD